MSMTRSTVAMGQNATKYIIEMVLTVQQLTKRDFKFDIYEMLEALICSRIVNPLSKYKTWSEIIPTLYKTYGFSLDQIYAACEFFGEEYTALTISHIPLRTMTAL